MDEEIETVVIRLAQQGDPRAWQQLFRTHFDPVWCSCMYLANGLQAEAEDIAQETFMVAACQVRRFDPDKGTFRSWLIGIARNRAMKLRTSEARRREREHRHAEQVPCGCGRSRDDLWAVHEALAELPAGYRSVLEGKYLRGLTVRQIADEHKTTEDAAESMLRRARDRFAQVYDRMTGAQETRG